MPVFSVSMLYTGYRWKGMKSDIRSEMYVLMRPGDGNKSGRPG